MELTVITCIQWSYTNKFDFSLYFLLSNIYFSNHTFLILQKT